MLPEPYGFSFLILPVQNRRALSTHSDSQHIVATSVLSYPHTIRSHELPLRQDLLYHSVKFIFQPKFTLIFLYLLLTVKSYL